MKIIDGKKIAEKIKDEVVKETYILAKESSRRPSLAIILIGDREDSKLYVSLKEDVAKKIGIDTSLYLIEEKEKEEDVIKTIEFLNQDDEIDGILVQLPLPEKFNTDKILQKINPEKDVDGFCLKEEKIFLSPVLMAIKYSLDYTKKNFKNKKAFLFFNSKIFKDEVKNFLKKLEIETDFISHKDLKEIKKNPDKLKSLQDKVSQSDILISALGCPGAIDKSFLNDKMTIIDIGITKKDQKVLGDVDYSSFKKNDCCVTPVPGGIGPITVSCLLKNVLDAFLSKNKKRRKE
jgi:methylenetetrahydrofolate dehydrogenase (NADP+) / methenyltetrahydrofolate cyclohydrolase